MDSVNILGVNISTATVPQLIEQVDHWVDMRQPRTIMYANAHCLNLAWEQPGYRAVLNQASLVCADGTGVVLGARLLGRKRPHKASGTEWFSRFCRLADRRRLRIYILAGAPGVAEEAARRIQRQWPGIQICGTSDGYFRSRPEGDVLEELRQTAPDVLFVGRGSPLQEFWVHQHRRDLPATLCWTVGSLFDLISGVERWPPPVFGRLGLQWLWRLIVNPTGKWRRYLVGNPRFIFRLLSHRQIDDPRATAEPPSKSEEGGPSFSAAGETINYPSVDRMVAEDRLEIDQHAP
ncbi:MAG: WecB/TagA/CpsF family glycosyltransferase [Anaerolineales bacterium]|nr:WecB/TagA/CpsF family glycosyltransferase [Anaerolineales bacterium]